MALGMSLMSSEYVDFHPSALLYLFWKATFLTFTVFPLCWISFSKMEASIPPDWNLFSGFGMHITSLGPGNIFRYLILRIYLFQFNSLVGLFCQALVD